MESARFDRLTRTLSTVGSRRALVAALAGAPGVLGLADPDDVSAVRSARCRRKPGECERCDRGTCRRKNGEKRCKAGKIKPKTFGTPCSLGSCQNGACIAAAAPTCAGLQEACLSSSDCCSDLASCGTIPCKSSTPGFCCHQSGEPCAHPCDCCILDSCNLTSGLCE